MNCITTFDQFREWVEDNKIVTWKISASTAKQNNDLRFYYDDDKTMEENLFVCRRRLEMEVGRRLYATGWRTKNATGGGFGCEIMIGGESSFAPQQVSGAGSGFSREELIRDVTQQVTNQFERERLKAKEKEIDEKIKQYESDKQGVMGLLVNYLAPVAQKVLHLPSVAGVPVENGEDVAVEKIVPVEHDSITEEPEVEPTDTEDFTDEESERLRCLMLRFKAVEPEYLTMIERVVSMAEDGDSTYAMAKKFLLNK